MKKTMKNMRKLVAMSSCVLMLGALTLTGCKDKGKDQNQTEQQKPTQDGNLGAAPTANENGAGGNVFTEKEGNKEVNQEPAPVVGTEKKDDKKEEKKEEKEKKVNNAKGNNAKGNNAKGNNAKKPEDKSKGENKIDTEKLKKGIEEAGDKLKDAGKKADDKKKAS